jgi:hypothetical protein
VWVLGTITAIHFKKIKKTEYNEAVHKLFIDFREAYDSARRDVLCNILIKFGVPMKLVGLIKMFLNETYSKVGENKEMLYHHCFSTLL